MSNLYCAIVIHHHIEFIFTTDGEIDAHPSTSNATTKRILQMFITSPSFSRSAPTYISRPKMMDIYITVVRGGANNLKLRGRV